MIAARDRSAWMRASDLVAPVDRDWDAEGTRDLDPHSAFLEAQANLLAFDYALQGNIGKIKVRRLLLCYPPKRFRLEHALGTLASPYKQVVDLDKQEFMQGGGENTVMHVERQPYKMSFATGGLLLNESVEVARLHNSSVTWDATLRRALEVGVTSLPKAESRRRTLREIVNRISTLNEEELDYLVKEADRHDKQALLWLATCRAYRFVHEFATEIIRERYLSLQFDLPLESFDVLFSAKAEWDDGLASISPMTRTKLRQILFRMMREANVISDDNRIIPAYLSPRLEALVGKNRPQDLVLFPGLGRNGGIS